MNHSPLVRLSRHPLERLLNLGPHVLTEEELCAVLLAPLSGAGGAAQVAHDLFTRYPTLTEIHRSGPLAVATVPSVGRARACRLAAGLELGRRMSMQPPSPVGAATAAALAERFHHLTQEDSERLVAVALTSRRGVLAHFEVGRGGATGVDVSPRDVLLPVLRAGAARLALVHNHPSGDPEPSMEDIGFTRRVERAASTLGVRLLDHVIVATGGYCSLRERGHVVG